MDTWQVNVHAVSYVGTDAPWPLYHHALGLHSGRRLTNTLHVSRKRASLIGYRVDVADIPVAFVMNPAVLHCSGYLPFYVASPRPAD